MRVLVLDPQHLTRSFYGSGIPDLYLTGKILIFSDFADLDDVDLRVRVGLRISL